MIVLANDGLSAEGVEKLRANGFEVRTDNVPQDQLADYINKENVEVLLVRSATTVRQVIFDACPGLKFVGRGGVGMDNIDVEYGRNKGVTVSNTPGASSLSVAELVMSHCFAMARFIAESNRAMPTTGATEFKVLKKAYGKGVELRGKTMGIVGMGRIGQALATYALGCGMKVIFHDNKMQPIDVSLYIHGAGDINVTLQPCTKEELVKTSDFISLHVPAQKDGSAVIGEAELAAMKPSAFIINSARGGSIDEAALKTALANKTIAGAALDVFVNEPTPDPALLQFANTSLTPHIGAATGEAQARIGIEMADNIISELAVKA